MNGKVIHHGELFAWSIRGDRVHIWSLSESGSPFVYSYSFFLSAGVFTLYPPFSGSEAVSFGSLPHAASVEMTTMHRKMIVDQVLRIPPKAAGQDE